MSKRLLLFGILILLIIPFTHANTGSEKIGLCSITDTTGASVKTNPVISSEIISTATHTKNGFNDLFLADATNGSKLNPRAVGFVQDYIAKNDKDLESMKNWGRPYFNMIDGILTQYGLPRELKYLAVIESQLKSNSVSWAGAVGPWQLMPATARVLGLKVTRRNDERRDYSKSTRAAAKYLKDLYNEFGDWLLVIAAYNGGCGHVYTAIRKSGSRNFWDLQYYLPTESRNHVKKFIGTHYIFEGQGGITTLTKEEATEQLSGSSMYVFHRKITKAETENAKTIAVSGKYHSSVISKYTLMDVAEFNRYNPEFDKVMASTNNTYELKLPTEKMELFAANKYQILNESVQLLLNGSEETSIQKTSTAVAVKDINK